MNVQFFKPFVEGTLHTLKVQCKTEAMHGKPFMKGQGPAFESEIIAIIGLASSAFSGTITLCFSKSTFLMLMSNMLDEKFEDITPDLQDGAAELLNIIFGHAKRVLNAEGYDIQKAIPSIMRGPNIQTVQLTHGPVVVLPFTSPSGSFQIEIAATESQKK